MILNLLGGLLTLVLGPIVALLNIPFELTDILAIAQSVIGFVSDGLPILNFFCPLSSVLPALTIAFSVHAAYNSYRLVMWVIGKIPFIGIETD